jgi:6-phosphofructokinase 1
MANKLRGALVVGQSGGPTAVINRSLVGVVQEAQRYEQIEEVLGMLWGIAGLLHEDLVDLKRQKPATLEGLLETPASALGSCRHKVTPQDYDRILEVFKAHNVRYFVYIGGNDSMDTAHRVGELAREEGYGLRVMGVPKTIDNDLVLTDHTPGYGSAARFYAEAIMDTGRDMEAMQRFEGLTVLETMGRNAGWLTAACALGKKLEEEAPHLVYVPERVFSEESFLEDVEHVLVELDWAFVAVSQGIRGEDGEIVGRGEAATTKDAFGHKEIGHARGVASYLSELVADELDVKSRFLRPSVIGRCFMSCVSRVDQEEAYLVGQRAVRHMAAGDSGHMVTLVRDPAPPYNCTTGLAPLEEVANAEKLLPDEYTNDEGNFVTDAFRSYATPLLGEPLPDYARVEHIPIPRKA